MLSKKQIYIGTSGWSYDHWDNLFYPEEITQSEWFSYYNKQFDTVEINNTFYQLPAEKTMEEWNSQAPANFLFSVKASRYITHMKKLNDPQQSTQKFFDRIKPLGSHLGPILFQLPPQWHINTERLEKFIETLPSSYRYVFEFRDESWFDQTVYEILEEAEISLCLYDFEGNETPIESTTDFIYIRMHGPGTKHKGSYNSSQLEKWTGRIEKWQNEGKAVYCYFNNDHKAHAPNDARHLIEMLNQ